jgi:hypothetical protein
MKKYLIPLSPSRTISFKQSWNTNCLTETTAGGRGIPTDEVDDIGKFTSKLRFVSGVS